MSVDPQKLKKSQVLLVEVVAFFSMYTFLTLGVHNVIVLLKVFSSYFRLTRNVP